jgi:hypothetical protein
VSSGEAETIVVTARGGVDAAPSLLTGGLQTWRPHRKPRAVACSQLPVARVTWPALACCPVAGQTGTACVQPFPLLA